MSTYDNKLSEWLKHVEQQEKELKSKKQSQGSSPQEETRPAVEQPPAARVQTEAPAREASTAAAVQIQEPPMNTVVVETSRIGSSQPQEEDPSEQVDRIEHIEPVIKKEEKPELFDETDIPPVEDFLSFLGRSRDKEADAPEVPYARSRGVERPGFDETRNMSREIPLLEPKESKPEPEPEPQVSKAPQIESVDDLAETTREVPYPADYAPKPATLEPSFIDPELVDPLELLTEGTGEPRPVHELLGPGALYKTEPEPEVVETEPEAEVEMIPIAQPLVEIQEIVEQVVIEQEAVEQAVIEQPDAAPAEKSSAQAGWERMPHHLQTLFAAENGEVAQHSYKAFRESRGQLIQRLLDPVISLEEAARILNVCPTTVRRYTNRGVLKHIRTAGNQRRFRLSDVLTFMESNMRGERVEQEA